MGKKGKKNILPTRLLAKKFLMTRNHPPHPQELNGRPLNAEVANDRNNNNNNNNNMFKQDDHFSYKTCSQ